MSFYTALSGLNAAQQDISVTSNNIANVSTFGFHQSRAEFSDIYFNNSQLAPSRQIGAGVDISRMALDFTQGTTLATGNGFDFAILGPGFFMTEIGPDEGTDMGFTRAGAFGMNGEGFVVNASGHYLNVFPTSPDGLVLSTSQTEKLRIPQSVGVPEATTTVDLGVQISLTDNGGLGSQAAVPPAAFDPMDPATFSFSTEIPMLDDLGNAIPAQAFFVLEQAPSALTPGISYSLQFVRDGEVLAPPAGAEELTFDGNGMQTGAAGPQAFTDAAGTSYSFDLSGSQTSRDSFAVLSISNDGESPINLSSVDVTDDGTVFANFGADRSIAVGQIALATFPNLQALNRIGDATYLASRDAGEMRLGAPLDTGFGAVQAGAVEQSNVDLTQELVQLIIAQRNYQASAKAIETNGTITDTIINIRT
ncbi:MAG: flagellar hook protein FlgE [Rhodobacteraceae bacterium]|nr:flagellar hook protein FlgE [Paracoccaceae bacterium]